MSFGNRPFAESPYPTSVALIKRRLGLEDGIVPILGYICRAFSVPLAVALPLREDGGNGPFARALQICVWFSTLVTTRFEILPVNWDVFWKSFGDNFSADQFAPWAIKDGELSYYQSPGGSEELFARGLLEIHMDKNAAFGLSDQEAYEKVKNWVLTFQRWFGAEDLSNGQTAKIPAQMKLEFQIEDQGPKYRVVCMLRAIKGLVASEGLEMSPAGA